MWEGEDADEPRKVVAVLLRPMVMVVELKCLWWWLIC